MSLTPRTMIQPPFPATMTIALLTLLTFIHTAQCHPFSLSRIIPQLFNTRLSTRQPTPNPLDYLDLKASNVSLAGTSTNTSPCAAVLDGWNLAFPNARAKSADEAIDCRQRLVFKGIPAKMGFTVIAVEVGGRVTLGAENSLKREDVVAEVGVGVGYLSVSSSLHVCCPQSEFRTSCSVLYFRPQLQK